jgi:hypothetical protein
MRISSDVIIASVYASEDSLVAVQAVSVKIADVALILFSEFSGLQCG